MFFILLEIFISSNIFLSNLVHTVSYFFMICGSNFYLFYYSHLMLFQLYLDLSLLFIDIFNIKIPLHYAIAFFKMCINKRNSRIYIYVKFYYFYFSYYLNYTIFSLLESKLHNSNFHLKSLFHTHLDHYTFLHYNLQQSHNLYSLVTTLKIFSY